MTFDIFIIAHDPQLKPDRLKGPEVDPGFSGLVLWILRQNLVLILLIFQVISGYTVLSVHITQTNRAEKYSSVEILTDCRGNIRGTFEITLL